MSTPTDEGPTLGPTNTCFDDALDFLEAVGKEHGRKGLEACTLVHGICMMPSGHRYAHAWVEANGGVIQMMMFGGQRTYMFFEHEDFERLFRPQETTRYTAQEAARLNGVSGHYGPWEERYQALCGGGRLEKLTPQEVEALRAAGR